MSGNHRRSGRGLGAPSARGAALFLAGCSTTPSPPGPEPRLSARVFLTSSAGDAARDHGEAPLKPSSDGGGPRITVHPDRVRQTFLGAGGSLTQASAAALSRISKEKRAEILDAYFGPDGARYAMTRTHIGSSDFSEYSYTYTPDDRLEGFTIEEDRKNGLLDLIRDAQAVPGASFRIIASPWTAPAWMKDNKKLYEPEKGRGGNLLEEHYGDFSDYFVKYLQAYAAEGIGIWAITPVNEPQGNNGTWESMEMTPEIQRNFLRVLGPRLRSAGLDTEILIFDQNRKEMVDYTQVIFNDEEVAPYTFGTAVHWYNSTFRVYEDVLDAQHALYPDKVIIQSEGTIDSVHGKASCEQACPNPPCGCEELYAWWQDDAWYWRKEATDWGWDWAPNPEVDHPKYAPAFRYARDLVVGLGHWLSGWVDWNIVLDKRGGPNHVENFCLAPVMVDGETDTVYYTPLFHIMKQFSRNTRPGGQVLETTIEGPTGFVASSIRNPDGSIAVHVFNESGEDVEYALEIEGRTTTLQSPDASFQTVVISP
jgi:glucosylceramidase